MRSWFGTVVAIGATIFLSFFTLLCPLFGNRYGATLTHLWAVVVLWGYGIKTEISGREQVGDGPYVIVANHSSMLDICAMAACVPLRFHFVSRPFFFKVPFLGWGMRAAGHISIERSKAREAAQTLNVIKERLQTGLSVCLFPEGTRSPDGTVQRYKRGPFLTAVASELPVLPVALSGVAARLPKGKLMVTPGPIGITFGEPIQTTGMNQRDTKTLARGIEDWTRAATNTVSNAEPAKA